MFSPDQAGDVHVPQEDSVSASFASEPERNQTGPPKNTDGTEHLSFRAVSENGAPDRGRGGVLSLDHENGVAANAMFALGQSGNPVSDDMGSAAITSFEDTPIAEGEHVSERAEQNTPEDSYSRGDCGIVLSEPVSMPIEDSGFIQNPSAGSHTQDPVADPQHYEASPRNDEQVFSGKDHGPSPSGDENAAERLDQNGDEHLQLSTSNEPPDNQISEENNEILLSEPVSMAMEESSSGVQHESDDMGQSGSIIEEAGCGLLLSDPVSMSVDCHTDIPTLVSDTDAQDISPQPHVDVDETPALEISNITGSTRNCDVSGLLPAKFVSKCRENGVAKLLLECSKSSASFIGLSSLTDLVSVQSSAWEEAGGKSRVAIGKDCRAPARILVQRRLGYVPVADGHGLDTPKGFDDAALNICANHRQLLISAFPLDRCCGACRKGVDVASDADVHVISVSMSERFTRFLPDLVAGQPLCGTCHKGLVISIKAGKREFRTEASMANQLKQYQLIHEDNYKSVLDSCRERFGMSLKKRWSEDGAKNNEYSKTLFPLQDWVIFNDSRAPFDTSASKVPPLRFLARTKCPQSLETCQPAMTVREYIELIAFAKNFYSATTSTRYTSLWPMCHASAHPFRKTLMRATDGRTPYWDLIVNAFAFLNVYTCLGELASDAGAEDAEKVIGIEERLSTFLSLKAADVLFCPDDFGKEDKFNISVVYRASASSELKTLCLASAHEVDFSSGNYIQDFSAEGLKPDDDLDYACVQLLRSKSRVSVDLTTSKVPSLRLLASSLKSSQNICENVEEPWKHLSVAGALELRETLFSNFNKNTAKRTKRSLESLQQVYKLLTVRKVVLGVHNNGFVKKVSEMRQVLSQLTEDTLNNHPTDIEIVYEKARTVLNASFHLTEPEIGKTFCGIWLNVPERRFICAYCPYMECDGFCASDYYKSVGLRVSPRFEKAKHLAVTRDCDVADDDNGPFLKLGDVRSLQYENGGIGNTYALVPDSESVIFEMSREDFEVGKEYLENVQIECWSCAESGTINMRLTFSNGNEGEEEEVLVDIEEYEKISLSFSGSGIGRFVNDVLPEFAAVTSSSPAEEPMEGSEGDMELMPRVKLEVMDPEEEQEVPGSYHFMTAPEFLPVDENGQPEGGHFDDGGDPDYNDDGGDPDYNDDGGGGGGSDEDRDYSPGRPSATRPAKREKNNTGPSASASDRSCEICGSIIKSVAYYYIHVKNCLLKKLPKNFKAQYQTKDGKVRCIGCKKTFTSLGCIYAKHVVNCGKAKFFGGFACDKCGKSFPTLMGKKVHMAKCKARGGRRHPAAAAAVAPARYLEQGPPRGYENTYSVPKKRTSGLSAGLGYKMPMSKVTEYHTVMCKIGNYTCPICAVRFRLNQPYGRHVQNQDCLKTVKDKKAPENFHKLGMMFVTIFPGKAGSDSIIAQNRVPSLRLLCRGVMKRRSMIKSRDLPPMTVKEAIEMHRSLKISDNQFTREERWKYFMDRHIFRVTGNVLKFFNQAISILKVIDHLEGRINYTRSALKDRVRMEKWAKKLTIFLKIPFHDYMSTRSNGLSMARAIEYPGTDSRVKVLCLSCPEVNCIGCIQRKVPIKPEAASRATGSQDSLRKLPSSVTVTKYRERPFRLREDASASNYRPSKLEVRNATKVQLDYYNRLQLWKSKSELKRERMQVGNTLKLGRPASMAEVYKYKRVHRGRGRPRVGDDPGSEIAADRGNHGRPEMAQERPRGRQPSEKQLREASQGQLKYYNALNTWLRRDQLRNEREKLTRAMGRQQPVSVKELIVNQLRGRGKTKGPKKQRNSAVTFACVQCPATFPDARLLREHRKFGCPRHKSDGAVVSMVASTAGRAVANESQRTAVAGPKTVVRVTSSSNAESDSGGVEQLDAAALPWMLPAVEDVNPLGEVDFEDADADVENDNGDCILPD